MNQLVFEPIKPVVQTKFGALRGVTYGGVNIFMGVRYAKAKRFMMPEEQDSWEGIKNAYRAGPVSKLVNGHNPFDYYRGLHLLHAESEDCQNLNIWAPKTLNGSKKPVFVFMHGGGFSAGNAVEEYSFDGFNLAHYGDVVFVSINHRLNILAHFNLSEYGEQFKESVNVGMADLVAALKWIHENIEAFGGDPENVTICGHSGGGGKVLAMYQIEEAAKYFTRGICMSGIIGGGPESNMQDSAEIVKAVLDDLGITKENIDKVFDVPYEDLTASFRKIQSEKRKEGKIVTLSPMKTDYFYGLPGETGFAPWSADKPLMIGTVLGEFTRNDLTEEWKMSMTEEDKIAYLKNRFGVHADNLLELFRKAYPTHDILDLAYVDTMFRVPALRGLNKKVENGCTNTWNYLCAYNPPENGYAPIWHGGDVCYVFMNEDKVFVLNEAVYGQQMANIFSNAFLNFTKYGDPNCNYLPKWEPYTAEHHNTMVIDKVSELKESFDEELVNLVLEATPKFKLF